MFRLFISQFFIFLICFNLTTYGQGYNQPKENIPSTGVLITPPPGFKAATYFPGFEKDSLNIIMGHQVTGASYYVDGLPYNRESFEAKGRRVYDFQELTISGYPAKLLLRQSDNGRRAYDLVFGDQTFCAFVRGVFVARDTVVSEQIKQAIINCNYDKNIMAYPIQKAIFTVDDTHSKFKLAKTGNDEFLYSIGGVNKNSYDEAFITIAELHITPGIPPRAICIKDHRGLLQDWAGEKWAVHGQPTTINGYDAYEEDVPHVEKGVQTLYYQVVLVSGDKALAVQCKSPTSSKEEMDEMKKMIGNIRFKQ